MPDNDLSERIDKTKYVSGNVIAYNILGLMLEISQRQDKIVKILNIHITPQAIQIILDGDTLD